MIIIKNERGRDRGVKELKELQESGDHESL